MLQDLCCIFVYFVLDTIFQVKYNVDFVHCIMLLIYLLQLSIVNLSLGLQLFMFIVTFHNIM